MVRQTSCAHSRLRVLFGARGKPLREVDVSCPGREATAPPRLHSGRRRGVVERPPRKPCGSARAAPVLRLPAVSPSEAGLEDSAASSEVLGVARAAVKGPGTSDQGGAVGVQRFANAVALIGAALQLIAAVVVFAPEGFADLAKRGQVDVSCPGREATAPPRLHSGRRRGNVERPPRKPCGSARAEPVLRRWNA